MIKSLFPILVDGCSDFIETSISDFLQQAGSEVVNADAIDVANKMEQGLFEFRFLISIAG